jgi:hypothetical protein
MAERIPMRNKNSGIQKDGFYGYSWTTLFFGPFVPLFRADFLTFLGYFAVVLVVGLITAGIGGFICFVIWSFFYNSYYTKKLLEKGYEFSGTEEQNEEAARVLEVQTTKHQSEKFSKTVEEKHEIYNTKKVINRSLDDDAYKIYLVKKFPVEFNDVLKKHIFNEKLYDSIDDVLVAMHDVESEVIENLQKQKDLENEKFKGKFESLRKDAQPYLDIILSKNYELLNESIVGNSIVWEFKATQNGSTFEFKSIEQLRDFSKNF